MKNWLIRFMAGRNGTDNLSRFLSLAAIVFLFISMFTNGSAVGSAAFVLALACIFISWFRTLSKNIYKRRQENDAYLRYRGRFTGWFKGVISRMKQRRDYNFYRCPSCKTWLRVPKGKGKVNITCRNCGERFIKKT